MRTSIDASKALPVCADGRGSSSWPPRTISDPSLHVATRTMPDGGADAGGRRQRRQRRRKKQPPLGAASGSEALPARRRKPRRRKRGKWWMQLDRELVDPITLAPIAELSHPPFRLEIRDQTLTHYFDAAVLATYVVSTNNFQNPINREPLTREECLKLDAHLRANGLPAANVAEAFDLHALVNVDGATSDERAQVIRRDAAGILRNLFDWSSRGERGGGDSEEPRVPREPFRPQPVDPEGIAVVDDDEGWDADSAVDHDLEFPLMGEANGAPLWVRPSATEPPVAPRAPAVAVPPPPAGEWGGLVGGSLRPRAPHATAQPDLSWRGRAAMAAAIDVRRPKLRLQPRGSDSVNVERQVNPNSTIFGTARPREETLASRGVDWRSADEELSRRVEPLGIAGGRQGSPCLCPYAAPLLASASEFGLRWVGQIEERLAEFITRSRSPSVSLATMTAPRRAFLHELLQNYWGLETASCDPEPNRFVQAMRTSHTRVPQLLLSRALVLFPKLTSRSARSPRVPSLTRQGSRSCSSTTSRERFHGLLLYEVCVRGSSARPGTLATVLHDALDPFVRRSNYHLHFLSDDDILIEFTTSSTLRKANGALQGNSDLGACIIRGGVQIFPAGVRWAREQLELRAAAQRAAKANDRELRKRDQTHAAFVAERNKLQAGASRTGWDDDDARRSHTRSSPMQKPPQPPQESNNAFDVLNFEDD